MLSGGADYKAAKRKAASVLQENFILEPPVRVDQIAAAYGLRVTEVAFPPEHDDVSGFIDLDNSCIVVNKNDPVTRRIFTVAHELGHWLLHREQILADPERAIVLRVAAGKNSDPMEQEANCFAAELLVPKEFLARYKDQSIEMQAKIFGVSTEVISYRR